MKKELEQWTFVVRPGRPTVSKEEAVALRKALTRSIKIGIELEYNLPEATGTCNGADPNCPCVNAYKVDKNKDCYDVCLLAKSCDIEKTSGCPRPPQLCSSFSGACLSCKKFNRGCTACDKYKNPNNSPDRSRQRITDALAPTRFLGQLGKNGILDVTKDGSLVSGGVEIVTVGQRVSFNEVYKTCRKAITCALKEGAYVNERTSTHYHILTSYIPMNKASKLYNSERPFYGLVGERTLAEIRDIEQPIPELVLANFHQLWRRYENAIIWLSSTGDRMNHLTRWIKFRRSLLKFSALRSPMSDVITQMSLATEKQRYSAVNYVPTVMTPDGNIDRLHFEVRVADGNMSPSAIAAMACLFNGMLLKAVDLSRYGILESGDAPYMQQARDIQAVLCNNTGDYNGPRHSDTSMLGPYIETLSEQARELVRLVKSYLLTEPPSWDILMLLAERPISIMRSSDKASWTDIEERFSSIRGLAPALATVDKIIDVGAVSECANMEEWIKTISLDMGLNESLVREDVTARMSQGELFWNTEAGRPVRS